MRNIVIVIMVLSFGCCWGCTAAVVGGGAGGYKAATDERTVGNMVDDATISSRIKTALIRDDQVAARKIDVDVVEGRVILTGVVESRAEADRAVQIARRVKYVRSVKDNLQIGKTSIGEHMDDAIIGAKINAKLIKEKGIRSLNIDVDVNRRVVTLTGIVKSRGQMQKVLQIARTTGGVARVVNNLQIK